MKAVYAGSFDPFTNGHLEVYKQASKVFSEVILVIANNAEKKRRYPISDMYLALQRMGINVVVLNGLVADYCKENNIDYMIRGLRNTGDYLYEENIAKINAEINPNLKTVYFRAENPFISSSFVYELQKFNKGIRNYVPTEVYKILNP